ncbi:S-adenosyl-L-methionine-dependent methyltransferase [Suillus clintonianus]|uniref:S-adenosyl-L-methionine-dependent methyltransferase n=1 Tax=Suillus clintonianus TaxID=1904413 RepID=UPI001B8855C7|nr:S-adenosyl-L-methionine-dependent methyltransferase [Suillus clintonianus]KAG2155500.1 S-adenosyl-L-methionine-dependent methyltransferase [Suillus clintonianus]
MIPTPDLSHLTRDDLEQVYDPAEDTFLLLDALEQEAEELRKERPLICLEVGSGSGCVSAFLGRILGQSSSLYLCTDINKHATRCTLATGKQNKITLDPVTCSLTRPLSSRLRHAVDILLFNPPYVPTDTGEASSAQNSANIAGSWAGGTDGMEITNLLLRDVECLLSPRGRFYLVALKQNDVPSIRSRMLEEFGLTSQIVIERRAGKEFLLIIRFTRTSP